MASYKNDNANKKIKIQKQTTVSGCCCPLLNLGPRDIIIQIFGLSYINDQYFGEMKPDNTQNKSLKLNCLYIYMSYSCPLNPCSIYLTILCSKSLFTAHLDGFW